MKPMNEDLPQLLDRWREGSLSAEEMRSLTELLAKPDARAALRRDWFLEAALPQSLSASTVIVRTPRITAHATSGSWRWTPAHWTALGAAATITFACLIWEHFGSPPGELDVFAAQVAAASLEP